MRAQTPTNLFLALFHLWSAALGQKNNAQIRGIIADLNMMEGGNVGADPVRKLRDGHISILDPIARFVVKRTCRRQFQSSRRRTPRLGGPRAGRRWREQARRRKRMLICGATTVVKVQV